MTTKNRSKVPGDSGQSAHSLGSLDPEHLEKFLALIQVSKEDYQKYIDEVLKVFPIVDAQIYAQKVMKKIEREDRSHNKTRSWSLSLHPGSFETFHKLEYHPVLMLLYLISMNMIISKDILIEITNLGKDLWATKAISRIIRIKNRLKSVGKYFSASEYIGALFELEVLASLQYANMSPVIGETTPDFVAYIDKEPINVEARHQGTPLAQAVALKCFSPGMMKNNFGLLSVRLGSVGSKDVSLENIAETISSDIDQILQISKAEACTIKKETHEITHDPNAGPRDVAITYDENIAELIRNILEKKEANFKKTINGNGSFKGPCIVALDLRSPVPAIISKEKRTPKVSGSSNYFEQKTKKWRDLAPSAAQAFIRQSKVIDGVLIWWKDGKSVWPCSDRDAFQSRYRIQIISRQDHHIVEKNSELQTSLKSIFIDAKNSPT